MGEFSIHNVRFYEFHPEAIHCIVYSDDSRLLALSRADGSIELWDCQAKPFKQSTFIGLKGSSVESLVWCGDRLFSAGLNGFILEYNIQSFMVKNQVSVTGGPTWCLALSPNKQLLVAGTEEGYVCLFEVTEEGLLYNKTLKRQKSRILSIGWHADSEHIVTGSVNYVHLLSIKTEQTLQFPVAKINPSKETIVWCVALLDDKTIVTGDSRGKTCFWDGTFGTLINALQTHQADVLTMQVTPDSQSVYVAGVDPVIIEVRLVDGGGKQGKRKMWVKSVQRRIHTHDVRSLALTQEGKLFSGGVDTYLALSFYPPKTAIKYPATPPRGYISVARKSRIILLGYKNRVELWRLGRGHSEGKEKNRFLSLVDDRIKLAEIELKTNDRLEFCSVSPQSKWIAYVTRGKMKIYSFTSPQENERGSLKKIRCSDQEILLISQILWIDEERLVSVTYLSLLQVLIVRDGEVSVERTFPIPSGGVGRAMTSSEDGFHVAVLDSTNQVTIFRVGGVEYSSVVIPKTQVPATAFAINNEEGLFITYSNMTMNEFNIKTGFCTTFGRELINNPSSEIIRSNNVIQNISFYSLSHIFLHSSSFYVVNRNLPRSSEESPRACKTMKFESGIDTESNDSTCTVKMSASGRISTIGRSNHILYFSHLKQKDLISIETNPIWLLDSLPPALKLKKFGAS